MKSPYYTNILEARLEDESIILIGSLSPISDLFLLQENENVKSAFEWRHGCVLSHFVPYIFQKFNRYNLLPDLNGLSRIKLKPEIVEMVKVELKDYLKETFGEDSFNDDITTKQLEIQDVDQVVREEMKRSARKIEETLTGFMDWIAKIGAESLTIEKRLSTVFKINAPDTEVISRLDKLNKVCSFIVREENNEEVLLTDRGFILNSINNPYLDPNIIINAMSQINALPRKS